MIHRLPIPHVGERIRGKARGWLERFLPAEILGTVVAVAASYICYLLTNNAVAAAYAGSIGETVGFYAAIYRHDVRVKKRELIKANQQLSFGGYMHIAKDMIVDFGAAEIVDSLLLRPFFMYIFPVWLGNHTLGIVVGKVVSDICFYVPVMVIYEVRVWMKRNRNVRA